MCGWCQETLDGRIPVELDHINGNNTDNRLENLRILCPNCHSLQSTHRGKTKKYWSSGGIGIRAALKMLSAKAGEGSSPSWTTKKSKRGRGVAQLVECALWEREVKSSSLFTPTKFIRYCAK